MFCPKCGKVETLVSNGNEITCKECGFSVTYNEDMSLTTNDSNINFAKLIDWYNFQIRFLKDYEIPEGVIFSDNNGKLLTIEMMKRRKLLSEGKVVLTKDTFSVGEFSFNVKDILNASPISGTDLWITTNEGSFLLKGWERFNPLKYVLIFNRLNEDYKNDFLNIYYNLEEKR